MTTLEILRLNRFFSQRDLGRLCRLPVQSMERLENCSYPLDRIGPDGRAMLEAGLQDALATDLSLPELLSEA